MWKNPQGQIASKIQIQPWGLQQANRTFTDSVCKNINNNIYLSHLKVENTWWSPSKATFSVPMIMVFPEATQQQYILNKLHHIVRETGGFCANPGQNFEVREFHVKGCPTK